MSALLQLIPESERAGVERAARRVAGDNWEWAAVHIGPSGAAMCDNLAYAMAAIAPSLDTARLRLLHRFTLWTIVFDDAVDDPAADSSKVRAIQDRLLRTIDGDAEPPDAVCRTLAELLPALRAHGDAATFFHALRDLVTTSADHAVWSRHVATGETRLPTVDEYLEVAGGSIGYDAVAYGVLLLLGNSPGDESIVDPALSAGARAVRLANDLRSARRHRRERTLHILDLRDRDRRAITREAVMDKIDQYVLTHDELLAALSGPGSEGTRAALVRCLRIAVGVYRLGQLRELDERGGWLRQKLRKASDPWRVTWQLPADT